MALTSEERTRARGFAEVAIVTTLRNAVADCEAVCDYLNRFDAPIELIEHALDISGEVANELRRLHDDFDMVLRMQARESIEDLT